MKILIFLFFVYSSLNSINCYTIIQNNISQKHDPVNYNKELINFWIHENIQYDGYLVKALKFYSNGDLTFYPLYNINKSEFYTGYFNTKKDTLEIRILNNSFDEKFIYKINGSSLILEKIASKYHIRYPILDSKKEDWQKN